MAVVVSCAMAGAMVSTFALTRLDGVPRSVAADCGGDRDRSLGSAQPFCPFARLREQLQAEIAGSPEQAAHSPSLHLRARSGRRTTPMRVTGQGLTISSGPIARRSLLPIAIGTTMLGPQGLSTLCVLLALLVGLVAAVEGDVRSWRRIAARLVLPCCSSASSSAGIHADSHVADRLDRAADSWLVHRDPGGRPIRLRGGRNRSTWSALALGLFPAVHLAAATILAIQLQFTLPEDVIRERKSPRAYMALQSLRSVHRAALSNQHLRDPANGGSRPTPHRGACSRRGPRWPWRPTTRRASRPSSRSWRFSPSWRSLGQRKLDATPPGLGIAAAVLTAPFIPEMIEHVLQAPDSGAIALEPSPPASLFGRASPSTSAPRLWSGRAPNRSGSTASSTPERRRCRWCIIRTPSCCRTGRISASSEPC